jgi:hypothetical protein
MEGDYNHRPLDLQATKFFPLDWQKVVLSSGKSANDRLKIE